MRQRIDLRWGKLWKLNSYINRLYYRDNGAINRNILIVTDKARVNKHLMIYEKKKL